MERVGGTEHYLGGEEMRVVTLKEFLLCGHGQICWSWEGVSSSRGGRAGNESGFSHGDSEA